jgi:MFS family permease
MNEIQPGSAPAPEEKTGKKGQRWDWMDTFSSLQNRNFRVFLIGMGVSFLAMQMRNLAQNYLIFQLTGQAKSIGYVSLAMGVSMISLSFVGGIVADRVERRLLLILSQAAIVAIMIFMGVVVTMGIVREWHLILTAILIGIVGAFNMPARQTYVPDLVGVKNLINAMALNSSIMNLTAVAGPALAGVFITAFGIGPVYNIQAVASGVFLVTLFMIPVRGSPTPGKASSPVQDAVSSIRYIRKNPIVLDHILLVTIPMIFGGPFINFLPVFQEKVFHAGASELGWMMSAIGGGALISSLMVASLARYEHKGWVLIGSGIAFGTTLVLFSVAASMGNLWLSLFLLAMIGISSTAFSSLNNALIQITTSPEMRGRVMGLYMTIFGLQSLGAMPLGAMVDKMGAPLSVGIFGGISLLSVVIMAITRPQLRRL